MIDKIVSFALSRPYLSIGLGLAVASAIFSAGVRTGAHIEHLAEAGKREAIQEDLIQCQNETAGFRKAEADAIRNLRDVEQRLANADQDRLEYAERRAVEIQGALQRALNAIEPNPSCTLTSSDVDGLRDILGTRPDYRHENDSDSSEAG